MQIFLLVDAASLLAGFVIGVSFSLILMKLLVKRGNRVRILPPVDRAENPTSGNIEALEAALREIEERSTRGKITVNEIAEILTTKLPQDLDHDPVRLNLEKMKLRLKGKLEEMSS